MAAMAAAAAALSSISPAPPPGLSPSLLLLHHHGCGNRSPISAGLLSPCRPRHPAAGWRRLTRTLPRPPCVGGCASSAPHLHRSWRPRPLAVAPAAVATPLSDLYDFICEGPLLARTGAGPESVASSLDEWLRLGICLSRQLGFNELCLSEEQKIRIYQYYIPVFLWCKSQLACHRSRFKGGEPAPPLVIGVSAPQGSGKTTLVYSLEYLFNSVNSQAASVSIDDFYLTAEDQEKLAGQSSGNALLELRGNAGSHDLGLATETFKALCNLKIEGKRVKVPRYNKSANNGRGDRADPSIWPEIEGPLQVLLFEGWMLGFRPLESAAVKAVDDQLEDVNKNLEAYHQFWDRYVDSWIIIQVADPEWVYRWRLQAEIAMREDGKPGMTNEQVKDFVSRYIPGYRAYLPGLYRDGPKGAKLECTLQFEINVDRNPIG